MYSMIFITTILSIIYLFRITSSTTDNVIEVNKLDEKFTNGHYDEVIKEGNVYVKKYPKSYEGWYLLGWSYLMKENLTKSQQCIEKSIELDPDRQKAYIAKGILERKLDNLDKARENYLKAIRIKPKNAPALSSLLVLEIMEGNFEKAVDYGERAWKIRKDLATVAANLAVAYHYQGNFEKREELYKHAKRLKYDRLYEIYKMFNDNSSAE